MALTETAPKPTGQKPAEDVESGLALFEWEQYEPSGKQPFSTLLLEKPVRTADFNHILSLIARIENKQIKFTNRMRIFTFEVKQCSNLFADSIFSAFMFDMADIFMGAGQAIREVATEIAVFGTVRPGPRASKEETTSFETEEQSSEEVVEKKGIIDRAKEVIRPTKKASTEKAHPEEISTLEDAAKFVSTDLWLATAEYLNDAKARVDICPSLAEERTAMAKMELLSILVFMGSIVQAVMVGDMRTAFRMYKEVEQARWRAESVKYAKRQWK